MARFFIVGLAAALPFLLPEQALAQFYQESRELGKIRHFQLYVSGEKNPPCEISVLTLLDEAERLLKASHLDFHTYDVNEADSPYKNAPELRIADVAQEERGNCLWVLRVQMNTVVKGGKVFDEPYSKGDVPLRLWDFEDLGVDPAEELTSRVSKDMRRAIEQIIVDMRDSRSQFP